MLNPTTRSALAAILLTGAALAPAAAAQAQAAFSAPARVYEGQVAFASAERGRPIQAGGEVVASGQGFRPGQTVRLFHGAAPLTPAALTAGADGKFEARFRLPADASVGIHPIVVASDAPYYAAVTDLKVSPNIPISGANAYDIRRAEVTRGLYQSAASQRNNAVFVAAAVGRPPVLESELVRLNADTLAIEARVTPAAAPARPGRDGGAPQDGGVYAVYGVGVDDVNGNVWTTNTRQNTVAVYRQSDLSLVRQFEPGTVNHARDVVIDAEANKAYVSATQTPEVVVFDARSPEVIKRITINSAAAGGGGRRGGGGTFSAASLSLNAAAHRLYVVSNTTSEVAVIDTRTDEVLHVFPAPGARGTIGVSHDPQNGRIFVVAQGTDNLVVLDGETGAVIADTPVGAGALNVVFDPVGRRAYVTSRGASTITVTDADGRIVANLGPAPQANHVSTDGRGDIFAVTKGSAEAEDSNSLWRIQPRR